MSVYLGIDAGTTNIKAVLLDESGALLDRDGAAVTVMRPFEGACEIDMQALWTLLCGLCRNLRERNPQIWPEIKGVAISAQGDGLWPITKNGEPAGPAILWNDTRSFGFEDVDFDAVDAYLQANSSIALFAGAFPMILKWLLRNRRDIYDNIYRVLHCKDWLNFKLTGVIRSDYSDYSTAGINIFTKEHVLGLYDLMGIPEAKQMLPELIAPTQLVGYVTAEASEICCIPAGIPVGAGAIDVVATATGAGLTRSGDGCVILGTTLGNNMLIDEEQVNIKERSGSTLCSILPGRYIRLLAALSGSATIDWAKGVLAPELSFEQLDERLNQVPPGSRGILYHPYVSGERAPFRNPLACGGFYGLTVRHDRFDMLRAAYEGMALSIKDCHRILPKTDGRIYLSGGGAASDFICRLVAGALNKQVVRQGRKELAACGVVEGLMMAMGLKGLDSCADEVIFDPRPEEVAAFDALYDQFIGLRDSMEPFWVQRRSFSD